MIVQILLDHGYGAAGVAIGSVPAEGIKVVPVSQVRALFPILSHPGNRHKAVGFTPEQFHYALANTLSREESDNVYERYYIPAPGRLVWAGVTANFTPGHQDTLPPRQEYHRLQGVPWTVALHGRPGWLGGGRRPAILNIGYAPHLLQWIFSEVWLGSSLAGKERR